MRKKTRGMDDVPTPAGWVCKCVPGISRGLTQKRTHRPLRIRNEIESVNVLISPVGKEVEGGKRKGAEPLTFLFSVTA